MRRRLTAQGADFAVLPALPRRLRLPARTATTALVSCKSHTVARRPRTAGTAVVRILARDCRRGMNVAVKLGVCAVAHARLALVAVLVFQAVVSVTAGVVPPEIEADVLSDRTRIIGTATFFRFAGILLIVVAKEQVVGGADLV